MTKDLSLVRWFSDLRRTDTAIAGGKNSSLGEMISNLRESGINVPGGYATTAHAYWEFLEANELKARMAAKLGELDKDGGNLAKVGKAVRKMIMEADIPAPLAEAITRAYHEMAEHSGRKVASVAVRSSATAEDLPEASFAGQQETFLNIRGDKALLDACRRLLCIAVHRSGDQLPQESGFDHMQGRAFDRRAADGAFRHRRLRRHVLDRHRDRLSTSRAHQRRLGARRERRAGHGRSRRISGVQAAAGRADTLLPIVEKRLGGKAQKMIYARRTAAPPRNVANRARPNARPSC